MVLEKIPTFSEVKNWANTTLVTTVNGSVGDVTVSETPTGMISMWSGAIADIPSGWALCDGTNGTPNLQNKFIAGAGGQYSPGETGGSSSVQLTENEMPSHNHTLGSGYEYTSLSNNFTAGNSSLGSATSSTAGGDEAHENRPPYYALAYVMKL